MNSLAVRLNLALTLSLALPIGGAWWLGHAALHQSTQAFAASRLHHDAEALLALLETAPDGELRLREQAPMPIYARPLSGHYFKISDASGATLRSRSLWDLELHDQPLEVGAVRQWTYQGSLEQQLLARSAGYRLGEHVGAGAVTITVVTDLKPLRVELQRFERLFAAVAIGGFLALLLLQRLIVDLGFSSLRPIYRDIAALERGAARRLSESVPTEILPLVRKLNGLLAAYAERLRRSRDASGNLAHALKAPLSVLLQQLTRLDCLGADDERRCLEQIGRMRALIERELKRARLAGAAAPGTLFDPAAELPALRDLLLRMYPDKALSLECGHTLDGAIAADREDMLELAGTLLDNGCKWARGRVRCALAADAAGIELCVEDDGPGCTPQQLDAIRRRGARLDERAEGHGLGLSIAGEIADLYGGRLELDRSPALGGLRARVFLPVRLAPRVTG